SNIVNSVSSALDLRRLAIAVSCFTGQHQSESSHASRGDRPRMRITWIRDGLSFQPDPVRTELQVLLG
ncbi:hypothetical protein AB4142_33915, partial [Variovorax sp. 2RAF20]